MLNETSSTERKPMPLWYLFFCGICMGSADLIPGISGGTIAFIMGFYHQLLESIKTINVQAFNLLIKGHFKAFSSDVAWPFLLTLLSGISFAFISLASLFHFVLEHETYRIYLYSGFLGLILASFWFCVRQIKEWKMRHFSGLIIGAIIAYTFTGSSFLSDSQGSYAIKLEMNQPNSSPVVNYNSEHHLLMYLSKSVLSAMLAKKLISADTALYDSEGTPLGVVADIVKEPSYYSPMIDLWLVLCGAIAVCALLLPGISGSYFLTLLGVYPSIIGALADFTSGLRHFQFDSESFSILFSVGIGIIIGLLIFARFVSWLLRHYPEMTIATMSGFMIGALRSVWPFWSYTYALLPLKLIKGPQLLLLDPIFPITNSGVLTLATGCAIIGFSLVFLVEFMANKKDQKDLKDLKGYGSIEQSPL